MSRKLIFVYNADSGVFNTIIDIAHRIISPGTYSCNLCVISHSHFSEREEWRGFINKLDVECVFLHRDEFEKQYPAVSTYPVIMEEKSGDLAEFLPTEKINQCQSIDDLENAIISGLD